MEALGQGVQCGPPPTEQEAWPPNPTVGLTGHAETEDAAMLLQESLEQGALPCPRRSTQDDRSGS